jgi:hypothetical protein
MYTLVDRNTDEIIAGKDHALTGDEVLEICAGARSAIE